MEVLMDFYHGLPTFVRWSVDFLFTVVFLRGIVANELLSEGKKHWASLRQFWHSDRNQAIREHYRLHELGQSHQTESVLDCNEGSCLVFKTEIAAPASLVQSTSQ